VIGQTSGVSMGSLMALGGAFWMVKCGRAAWREWRSGVGQGRYGAVRREDWPSGYWTIVGLTAVSALLGLAFAGIGVFVAFASLVAG